MLDRAVAAGIAEPRIEESFSKLGVDIVREGTPETFSAFLAAQLEKWGDLARDVGAKVEIYRLMRALAEQGTVILMISSDMEEVLNISDRIAVMHEGEITGILERTDCTEKNIMQLAVGRKIDAAKPAFSE